MEGHVDPSGHRHGRAAVLVHRTRHRNRRSRRPSRPRRGSRRAACPRWRSRAGRAPRHALRPGRDPTEQGGPGPKARPLATLGPAARDAGDRSVDFFHTLARQPLRWSARSPDSRPRSPPHPAPPLDRCARRARRHPRVPGLRSPVRRRGAVAALLGVPLDPDDEPMTGQLDGLDHPVPAPRSGDQSGTECRHRLMMTAEDIETLAEHRADLTALCGRDRAPRRKRRDGAGGRSFPGDRAGVGRGRHRVGRSRAASRDRSRAPAGRGRARASRSPNSRSSRAGLVPASRGSRIPPVARGIDVAAADQYQRVEAWRPDLRGRPAACPSRSQAGPVRADRRPP